MIDEKLVVFFKEGKNNGCNFYRIRQPASSLIDRGNIVCAISSEMTFDDQDVWFDQADVIYTQVTSEALLRLMEDQKGKKRFVLDWDDNLFAVSPYNPAYQFHGLKEVEVEIDGKKEMLWQDGRNGFSIEANKHRMTMFAACARRANLITTTSPLLSGVFKRLNKNVKVIKNLIDFNLWKHLPLQKDDTIRIGWQGGWSHYEDWHLIGNVLKRILNNNPSVTLVIMGTPFSGIIKELPANQVQLENWVSIEAYPHRFRTLNIDIGIAPLENNIFNTCKSELKWEEYSALKIPCVCSNIPPYSLNVYDNDTGFLCSKEDEWVETLQRLIDDKALRERIGEDAYNYVRNSYDIDKEVVQYEDNIKIMCNMKKELILN